jgi:protein-L-isoaspartate(D-aspartate) O-methyltransferase
MNSDFIKLLKGQRIDKNVLNAIKNTSREIFVPEGLKSKAYENTSLPIGYEQTISQPLVVASMTQALSVTAEMKVLEVGTGSGYQAAVLSQLCKHVYTVERIASLVAYATDALARAGIKNISVRHGDGSKGWQEEAPFERIIVTAASTGIPEKLLEQLEPGGIMIIPIKHGSLGYEKLTKVIKVNKDKYKATTFMDVRFVPLLEGMD